MGISHVAELMSFLYTLPSYLQENPKVFENALIIFVQMTRRPDPGYSPCVALIFVLLPTTARDGKRKLVAELVARVLETDLHRRMCVSKSHRCANVTAVDQDGQGGRFRRKF
jgi:hypothetical protein